ncbi:MAG TPA: hypothetical protein VIX59_21000 [Candidatus Binataceae bacterium]
MSGVDYKELHFLLDSSGALIVYQEKKASWAGVLAFSSEDKARKFGRLSNLDIKEIGALSTSDPEAVAQLVSAVKRLAVRNLLLDLDYVTGHCIQVEFEGDGLGKSAERQFTPEHSPARA